MAFNFKDIYEKFKETPGKIQEGLQDAGKKFDDKLESGVKAANTHTEKSDDSSSFNFDPEEAAESPYGDLELSKYLYETGLQDVFKDYKENVERLSQKEQQSLQDAYYVKELSKKYAGEYASNQGVGDVSGHLMDIYSNYQKNIGDIKENYDALELNLEQEYQRQKMAGFQNILETEYKIEVAKLDEKQQELLFNIGAGNTDGMNPFEYLEEHKDELGDSRYQATYGALVQQTKQDIQTNLENGNFGEHDNPEDYINEFSDYLSDSDLDTLKGFAREYSQNEHYQEVQSNLEQGEYGGFDTALEYVESEQENLPKSEYRQLRSQVYNEFVEEVSNNLQSGFYGFDENGKKIEDPMKYLEQQKDKLSSAHYKELKEQIDWVQSEAEDNSTEVYSYNDPQSESYDPDFDPTYYLGDTPGVSKDSEVFEIKGVDNRQFVRVDQSVLEDENATNFVDNEELFEHFREEHKDSTLVNNTIIEKDGTRYVYKDEEGGGNWYRLISTNGVHGTKTLAEQRQQNWYDAGDGKSPDGAYQTHGDEKKSEQRDTLTVNGITYVEDKNEEGTFHQSEENLNDQQRRVYEEFKRVHGQRNPMNEKLVKIRPSSVVFVDGRFWVYNVNGRFTPMVRQSNGDSEGGSGGSGGGTIAEQQ